MWRALLAGGIVWVLGTALLGVVLVQRTLGAADEGVIAQPHSAQIVVAVMSIVIFGLPGVALALAGWRRRHAVRASAEGAPPDLPSLPSASPPQRGRDGEVGRSDLPSLPSLPSASPPGRGRDC